MIIIDQIFIPGRNGQPSLLLLYTSRGTFVEWLPPPPLPAARAIWFPVMGRPVAA